MQEKLHFDNNNEQGIIEKHLSIATCVVVTFLVLAEISLHKYFYLGRTLVSGRDLIYPLTFLVVNIIAEMYGAQQARTLIAHGLYISILITLLLYIAQHLPTACNSPVSAQDFNAVLGQSPGRTISFLGIYLIGQLSSLYLFTQLQGLASQQYFWLRNATVGLYGQLTDIALSTIVFHIAGNSFLHPDYIVSQYLLRSLVTLAGVLFLYILTHLSHQQVEQKGTSY